MAVDAHERDGMIRRDAIERVPGRKARARPQILVPIAPADPFTARESGRALAHAPRGRLLRGGAPQIQRETNTRQVHQVAVRVYEPGQRGAPAEVDDFFARRDIDVGAAAGERHRPSRTTSVSAIVPRTSSM